MFGDGFGEGLFQLVVLIYSIPFFIIRLVFNAIVLEMMQAPQVARPLEEPASDDTELPEWLQSVFSWVGDWLSDHIELPEWLESAWSWVRERFEDDDDEDLGNPFGTRDWRQEDPW